MGLVLNCGVSVVVICVCFFLVRLDCLLGCIVVSPIFVVVLCGHVDGRLREAMLSYC